MNDSWFNYNSFSFCSPKIIHLDMKMWKTTNPSSWWLAGMVWFINNISDTVCTVEYGAGEVSHTMLEMLFINQTIPANHQLEGLIVFHFSCQQIYSWFFHKQNRSESVNNNILCSLIYNYFYFQKKWICTIHLQIW